MIKTSIKIKPLLTTAELLRTAGLKSCIIATNAERFMPQSLGSLCQPPEKKHDEQE